MSPIRRIEPLGNWHKLFEQFHTSALEFYEAVEQAVARRQMPGVTFSRVDWSESGVLSAKREYLRIQRGPLVLDLCAAPFGTDYFFSWWLGVPKPWFLWPTLGALIVSILLYLLAGAASLLLHARLFRGDFSDSLYRILVVGWQPSPPVLLIAFVVTGLFLRRFETRFSPYLLAIPVLGWLWRWLFLPETYYRIDQRLMFQSAVHASILEVIDGLTTAKGAQPLTDEERKPIMKDFFGRKY